MKTLIAGSHGMIESSLANHLVVCGHPVFHLIRSTPGPGEIDASGLEGLLCFYP